jgi:hypothetical protein
VNDSRVCRVLAISCLLSLESVEAHNNSQPQKSRFLQPILGAITSQLPNTFEYIYPRRTAAPTHGSMCITMSKEERVGRSWDEPARHIPNYQPRPARRTSPLPKNRRRYSNQGNDNRSSDTPIRYVYHSSQPTASDPHRDSRMAEK